MRPFLPVCLLLLFATSALAQNKTAGNIGIWSNTPTPNSLTDTGNAIAPGNFTVTGNLIVNRGLDIKGTGAPFTNAVPPLNTSAVINRISDRLFVGKETEKYDGRSHNLWGLTPCTGAAAPFGCTWVSSTNLAPHLPPVPGGGIFDYLERNAQLLVYSEHGQNTTLFATRSSDNGTDGCCAEGIATLVYNDNTSTPQTAWGTYNTSVRAVGAGSMFGAEFDIGNLGDMVDWYPFLGNGLPGITVPLWVACGGELADSQWVSQLKPCTAAMGILNNGGNAGLGNTPFNRGIVFGNNALVSDGGIYHAIEMPRLAQIEWWAHNPAFAAPPDPYGFVVGYISSSATTPAHQNGIILRDNGAHFVGPLGATTLLAADSMWDDPNDQFYVPGNYLALIPGDLGTGPALLAAGSDQNESLSIKAKGTGEIYFGNPVIVDGNLAMPPAGTLAPVGSRESFYTYRRANSTLGNYSIRADNSGLLFGHVGPEGAVYRFNTDVGAGQSVTIGLDNKYQMTADPTSNFVIRDQVNSRNIFSAISTSRQVSIGEGTGASVYIDASALQFVQQATAPDPPPAYNVYLYLGPSGQLMARFSNGNAVVVATP